jgi:hypothetical protein
MSPMRNCFLCWCRKNEEKQPISSSKEGRLCGGTVDALPGMTAVADLSSRLKVGWPGQISFF